jgi:UDP-N-acetylglucosamine 4,6-dehydratase/UDP-glucose 4-epimerase
VLSKDEKSLALLKSNYPEVNILVGDIADIDTCRLACHNCSGIFHLAAFKYVDLAETNVSECLKSNIIGSMNLLEMSVENKMKFIIGISTDKAANRGGVYGVSKWLMERLFQDYELKNPDTKYRLVRFGNIIYSTGSVLAKWKEKIINNLPVQVTDPESTRFYWRVEEAVELILDCVENGENSTPMSRPMKAIKTIDLLNAMLELYNSKSKIEIIGLQKGESMHERIIDNGQDSSEAEKFSKEEILKLIM